jgi:transposase
MTAALPEAVRAAKTPIEVWHQDEARVGQQGTLTYVWAGKGSRPAALRDQRRQSAYLFGAVCADRGIGAALVLPYANADAMSLHLAEISRHVAMGAHGVVVLDGAGWHQTGGRLRVPGNISLLRLPPYSPELNPQENVWQYLRQNQLSNRVFANYDAVIEACCIAWNALMAIPDRIRSIATRAWTKTVRA